MARPRVLITGASSGIGAEFARRFASNGYDLILVARREALLNALRDELAALGANVLVIAKDLSLKTSAKALYQDVKSCNLSVDVLVNNAGVAYGGAFTAMETEAVQRMVLLNAATLATLTRLFVTDMVARGSGRILNVSSLSAFQAVPSMTLYAATKAFVSVVHRRARRRIARHRRYGYGVVSRSYGHGHGARHRRPRIDAGSAVVHDQRRQIRGERRVRRVYERRSGSRAGSREPDLGDVESDAATLAGPDARWNDQPAVSEA